MKALTLNDSGPVQPPETGSRNVCMKPTAAFAVASPGKSSAPRYPAPGSVRAVLYWYWVRGVAEATEETPMDELSTLL